MLPVEKIAQEILDETAVIEVKLLRKVAGQAIGFQVDDWGHITHVDEALITAAKRLPEVKDAKQKLMQGVQRELKKQRVTVAKADKVLHDTYSSIEYQIRRDIEAIMKQRLQNLVRERLDTYLEEKVRNHPLLKELYDTKKR